MSGFKRMVHEDAKRVFLNSSEFADLHTVAYDGETYEDIPLVMTGVKEQERKIVVREYGDRVEGLYLVTTIIHYAQTDLDVVFEKGMRVKISDGGFMREYYVASSKVDMGIVRAELEAIDE